MIYFTSDLHFGHRKIIELERYDCENVREHDRKIVEAMSKKLQDNDELYVLGDIGFPDRETMEEFKKLKGKKYLIMGNHDKKKPEFYSENMGFDKVHKTPIWLSDRIVLSHIPVPVENGVVNIHGHLHGSWLDMKNYVNANIYICDYRLIPMKKIDRLISQLEKPNYKFMKEWFASHQVLSNEQMEKRTDIIFDENGYILGKREE